MAAAANLPVAASSALGVPSTPSDLRPGHARFSPPFAGRTMTSPGAGLAAVPPQRDRDSAGAGATLTLGQLAERAWEGLHRAGGVTGSASCPVCRGPMERRGAVAECADCGARLW